ncbi:class II SORL domain-containing protein [candidate division WOR-3 bacterium]|nr:class II SORL domain-containing protein [candidate division WOR-3 bacterium]
MQNLSSHIQQADWKTEKHVPVIDCPDSVKAGEEFDVKLTLGKEVAHPNTTEHHIRWIALYFHPEGAKFPHQVGQFEFLAHGESTDGPNQGPVYTAHTVTARMKTSRPGVLHALASCNIHGLWESSRQLAVSA